MTNVGTTGRPIKENSFMLIDRIPCQEACLVINGLLFLGQYRINICSLIDGQVTFRSGPWKCYADIMEVGLLSMNSPVQTGNPHTYTYMHT